MVVEVEVASLGICLLAFAALLFVGWRTRMDETGRSTFWCCNLWKILSDGLLVKSCKQLSAGIDLNTKCKLASPFFDKLTIRSVDPMPRVVSIVQLQHHHHITSYTEHKSKRMGREMNMKSEFGVISGMPLLTHSCFQKSNHFPYYYFWIIYYSHEYLCIFTLYDFDNLWIYF
jgi:hypothetical protein